MAREKNFNGQTRQEVIRQTLGAAELEAVSLGEIISDGRMFELDDDELAAFVRKAILELLECGARCVEQSHEKGGEWALQAEFDVPNDEAVSRIMKIWKAKGREAAFLIWFYRGSIN